MRILWIGKRPTDGEGGDEVFDLRTIAACRNLGCDIDVFHPMPVGRSWKLAKMIIGLLPTRAPPCICGEPHRHRRAKSF
jgi:hypothetical protein